MAHFCIILTVAFLFLFGTALAQNSMTSGCTLFIEPPNVEVIICPTSSAIESTSLHPDPTSRPECTTIIGQGNGFQTVICPPSSTTAAASTGSPGCVPVIDEAGGNIIICPPSSTGNPTPKTSASNTSLALTTLSSTTLSSSTPSSTTLAKTTSATTTPTTIDPSPIGSSECFAIHDQPIKDLQAIISSDKLTSYCAGQVSNWRLVGSGGFRLPPASNYASSGYTLADNAPSECHDIYAPNHADDVSQLCALPLQKIWSDCPYNGGKVSNICGSWWLQTCPLGGVCPVGCPGGSWNC